MDERVDTNLRDGTKKVVFYAMMAEDRISE